MDGTSRCQRCDAPLTGQAVGGLCANCLLKLALEPAVGVTAMVTGDVTAPPREAVGTRIGRYKLLQEIGEGGFGIVYLADQMEPVKRRVALKVLKPGMDTREVIARFEAERQSLALMDHPNIARIFDGGATESGRPYFVMELVKGIPLTKYCDDQQLNTRQRLDLFLDVLAAVQHAHQKGLIHRDLKPSNILVSPHDGRPVIKVIDFGIAKAISLELTDKTLFTAHGRMIGTPQYMSPEQAEINALDVDTRSDLYALGVVLYELLTGRTPLDAKVLRAAAYAEIQRLIREEEPPKPSTRISTLGTALPDIARQHGTEPLKLGRQLRGDLDWIVMKALEKDRSRRYDTANGFAADLRRHLENQPVLARPPGAGYLLSRFVRRHKFGFAAAAAVAVALLAGIATTTWGLLKEAEARKTAEAATGRAEAATGRAESETAKAIAANKANKHNLHLASMADFAAAVKALDEDYAATRKGQQANGFAGKSRWHEGVALLTRSLEREPENAPAALRLHETLRSRQAEKRDWSLHTLKHGGVTRASFSLDCTRIVTASGNKTAQVRDVSTGQPIGEPMPHEGNVRSANFSPDGTRVVTVCDDTVRVWETLSGQPVSQPMRHESQVKHASFNPNGTKIVTLHGASGNLDSGWAQIWDASTSQAIGQPLRHEGNVDSASFSPDGTKIITASQDNTARVWDATTGQPIGSPLPHEEDVYSASFSPDGTKVVTASRDETARVWDATTGQPLTNPLRHEAFVMSASFSPDGARIVTASHDRTARVWDATTGQPTARSWDETTGEVIGQSMRHEAQVESASFSPDGTRVVTASLDKTARVWDAATAQAMGPQLGHEGAVTSARFSPDGTRIVTVSSGTMRVWDAATGQDIKEPLRHNQLTSANFSPNGARIVTTGGDATARIWDATTLKAIGEPLVHESWVITASFSLDGTYVVTTSDDEIARVWDTVTCQAIGEPMRHEAAISSAAFSPDGTLIVTASNSIRVWDAGTGQAIGERLGYKKGIGVKSARFSPDGLRIVSAGGDVSARVWEAATGHAIGEPMRHGGRVDSASFSPDGTKVVTASRDLTTRVWDAATGQAIGEPMRHERTPVGASFNPDGTKVLTAGLDQTARVWEAATGQAIGEPMRHGHMVYSASFSPDGTRIVTASEDKTARVWDAATGQAIGEPLLHVAPVRSASFSPDGTRVLSTSGQTANAKTALMWWILTKEETEVIRVITPEILAWARHFAGLRFSEDGELRLIPDEERLAAITNPALPAGPWADLARWINTPAPQRTIDPKSKSTLRQVAERERDFDGNGTVNSLKSALRYDLTLPLARLFLATALAKADAAKEAKDRDASIPQRAAFLRRYDLDALAREGGRMKNDELAALWVRAANHLLELPPDTKIGVGPKSAPAREEAARAVRNALDLVPGLPAAEEVLKKL